MVGGRIGSRRLVFPVIRYTRLKLWDALNDNDLVRLEFMDADRKYMNDLTGLPLESLVEIYQNPKGATVPYIKRRKYDEDCPEDFYKSKKINDP